MGMQIEIKMNVGTFEALWPAQVVDEIQKVMEAGEADHPHDSWKDVPAAEHIRRAYEHLIAAQGGYSPLAGKDDDHLANAFTRLMMAIAIKRGYVKGEEDDSAERI